MFGFPPPLESILAVLVWCIVLFFVAKKSSLLEKSVYASLLATCSKSIFASILHGDGFSLDRAAQDILSTYFGQVFMYFLISISILFLLRMLFNRGNSKSIFSGK